MATDSKPFKIWSCNRQTKISLTAKSFEEAIFKGCKKLDQASEHVTVVLEEDGTVVDDEDYFAFIPENTVLMFLIGEEKWTERGKYVALDETDDGSNISGLDSDVSALLYLLKNDVTKVATLSDDQIQQIIDCDTSELSHFYSGNERFTKSLQEGCQRHLDDRSRTSEVMDLLRIYHKSQQQAYPQVTDDGAAKKRKI